MNLSAGTSFGGLFIYVGLLVFVVILVHTNALSCRVQDAGKTYQLEESGLDLLLGTLIGTFGLSLPHATF